MHENFWKLTSTLEYSGKSTRIHENSLESKKNRQKPREFMDIYGNQLISNKAVLIYLLSKLPLLNSWPNKRF